MIPLHPLTNFEIRKYYQSKPRFNGVYSRDNLPDRIKDEAYVINLDEHSNIGTPCIDFYNSMELHSNDSVTYFDNFGAEENPKESKEFIGNKNIKPNIFRIPAYDSVLCGYFFVGFVDFIPKGKSLTDFNNLSLPNN